MILLHLKNAACRTPKTLPYHFDIGVEIMNSYLITVIISLLVALFNLYTFIQQRTIVTLILCVIWLLVALKYYKEYKKNKDKNSENNA